MQIVSFNDLNDLPSDYIIEYGTYNTFTYRKWSSGMSECWGSMGYTNYDMSLQSGNAYYAQTPKIYFPANLFINTPGVSISVMGGNGLKSACVYDVQLSYFIAFIFCSAKGTQGANLVVHAKGRWK